MSIFERLHLRAGRDERQSAPSKPDLSLHEQVTAAQRRRRRLRLAGRVWDPTVRRLLIKLARARWPEQPHVGRFPVFVTRIRRNDAPEKITWWVEHDLPPYDRYRCAAYFVDLEIGDDENCVLVVRSGQGALRLGPPTTPELERALAEALRQPPAIIPRRMGEAWD